MLCRKRNVLNVRTIYNAFSLVEILISMALGTLVLLSMFSLYSQLYRDDKQYLEKINLQMQAHQFIDYLKHHLQHSGYLGSQRENTNYTDFLINNKSYYIEQNCILFFYDGNNDGRINHIRRTDPDEIFGFRFNHNEIYEINTSYPNYTLQKETLCHRDNWKSIAKDFQFTINDLNFRKMAEDLIQIDINIRSRKYPNITYQITSYTYLLNGRE